METGAGFPQTRKTWPTLRGKPASNGKALIRMKSTGMKLTALSAGAIVASLLFVKGAHGQAPAGDKPPLAEQAFKNVQVLKGITADEFLGTMGAFSAALGWSCEDCHKADDTKWENFGIDNPAKVRTRQMIQMMQGINKTYFGGRQAVTCFSCHHGANHPKTTPNLATLYYNRDAPFEVSDDILQPAPNQPSADQILDRFIQAMGGAQKLAAVTSIVAKGTNSGYGPESGKRQAEIYAKSPAQRTLIVHTDNGDQTTVFDGRNAWYSAPLRPIPVLSYSGAELAGMKLEAEMEFPGRIKQFLTNLKVAFPQPIGDKDYQVVQGTTAEGTLATLFFDPDTGLLTRMVRYTNSVVGRFPTMIDYADYRDVNGVKIPFRMSNSWLDGREQYELTDVQVNTPIEAAKFAKPAPATTPKAR